MAYLDDDDRRRYAKRHYEANRPAYLARAAAHNAKTNIAVKDWLFTYLKQNPCVDCGESDIIVLEFDHKDGVDKKFNIGDAARKSTSLKAVVSEVAKCDVRCANCHRRKTYKQSGRKHRG